MEQKYQIGNEHGSILWDVGRMLADCDHFPLRRFDVQALAAANPFHGSEEHIMATDPSQPLLVVQLCAGVDKLIDGNHRLQKALRLGIKEIEAYYLPVEVHRRYIVDYHERVYEMVVKAW